MTNICDAAIDHVKRPSSPKGNEGRPLSTFDQSGHRRLDNADRIQDLHPAAEAAKNAALRAPARVKRATGGPADVVRALENRHRWLLFAQHCYTCSRREEECELGKLCTYGKKTLKHVAQCKKDDCSYPRCGLLKPLLQHSRRCQSSTCAICVPVWNYIQKDIQQQQQQPPVQAAHQQPSQPQGPQLPQQPAPQPQPAPQGARNAHADGLGAAASHGAALSTWGQTSAPDPQPGGGSGPGSAASSRTDLLLAASGGANGAGDSGHGAKPVNGAGGAAARQAAAGSLTLHAKPQLHHASDAGQRHPTGSQQLQQQPGLAAAAAVASAPSGGTHRVLGVALGAPGSSAAPPYTLPPYTSGLTAALSAQLEVGERSKVVTTGVGVQQQGPSASAATPPPPLSIPISISAASARAAGLPAAPAGAAGHSPLVHSYPPSGTLGAFFPHLMQHHPLPPHHTPGASGAAQWLPLQGLTAPAGTAGGGGGNGGVVLGAGGGPTTAPSGAAAAPPGATVWAGPAHVRAGGPVALYSIPPSAADGARSGAVGGQPAVVPIIERFGHAYSVPGVGGGGGSGGGGGGGGAYAVAPAHAPLLLWPTGHQPPPAQSAGPSTAQGASPPAHVAAHLPATYAVAGTGAPRGNGATAPASVGGGHPPGMSSAPAPPGHVLSAHALLGPPLFGQHALGTSANGGGGGGGVHGPGSVPAELATGAALWSYVLR